MLISISKGRCKAKLWVSMAHREIICQCSQFPKWTSSQKVLKWPLAVWWVLCGIYVSLNLWWLNLESYFYLTFQLQSNKFSLVGVAVKRSISEGRPPSELYDEFFFWNKYMKVLQKSSFIDSLYNELSSIHKFKSVKALQNIPRH